MRFAFSPRRSTTRGRGAPWAAKPPGWPASASRSAPPLGSARAGCSCESPYPPSPSRRTLHPVVTVRYALCRGARCWALRCADGGIEPPAPAHDATPCSFGSCRLVHAARLDGYRLTPLFEQIRRPVRLLDRAVELAPIARQLVGLAPQGADVDGGQDPDLGAPVALLALAGDVRDLPDHRLPERERVATRKRVRQRRAVGEPRRQVRVVDPRDEPLELRRDVVDLGQQAGRILGRLLALVHERARLEPAAQLLDPGLQLASERQCLAELHDRRS